MQKENGHISIHTENILPIIKKWLYSDKDIFIRELVSNSSDAITKFKKLATLGEAEASESEAYRIDVVVDKATGTLRFSDNGIGMTGEEVKKYINQIAFSGALEFVEKYKDKSDEGGQIIGHFGLGFYSAFMVSDKVQIDTLSFQNGAEAVRWSSSGGTEFDMDASDRNTRGTTVTLFLADDSKEYLDAWKVREVLRKYCAFLPFEIYVKDSGETDSADTADITDVDADIEADLDADADVDAEATNEDKTSAPKETPINDTHPLWLKNPKDCTDEEYKEFYRKVFMDFNEPLFWIHLNMDYPFNLKGILYFPKLKHEFETMEGQIKLYYNQVFVAENIKEVIPEFLLL